MLRSFLALALLIFANSSSGQAISPLLEAYQSSHHQEKIYIAHDKPSYITGETIWGKLFLVDAVSHMPFDATPLVYVDWFAPDGTLMNTYHLQVQSGSAALSISTSVRDTAGLYTLRAYTQYQRNFDPQLIFQKQILLIDPNKEIENTSVVSSGIQLDLFPEGGYLVTGLENTLAFLARNKEGEGIKINGRIENQFGTKVSDLQTLHDGMGLCRLFIEAGKDYRAVVHMNGQEKVVELPASLEQGVLLSVNSVREQELYIALESTDSSLLAGARLLGHLRGQVFWEQVFESDTMAILTLEKDKIPSGLLHFTLFDAKNRPMAERLVFNHNPLEQVELEIDIIEDMVHKKSMVKGAVSVKIEGVLAVSDASISVFHTDFIAQEYQGIDIANYLLLQSDLVRKIPNIQQYFSVNDVRSRTLLDLLLMTHTWRRFKWQQVLNQEVPNLTYPIEQNFSLSGVIRKEGSDKPVESEVSLSILDEDAFSLMSLKTEKDGLFYFKGFEFKDTTNILIQASTYSAKKSKKRKENEFKRLGSKYVDIELMDLSKWDFQDRLSYPFVAVEKEKEQKANAALQLMLQERIIQNDLWSIDLEEVTVSAKLSRATIRANRIKKIYREKGLFYIGSTQKFALDEPQFADLEFRDVFDLVRRVVPRAKVIRENGYPKLIYGRLSAPSDISVVLDGQIIRNDFLQTIDPASIAFIDVIPPIYGGALYGTSGYTVSMLSKSPSKYKAKTPGILNVLHPGYYQAREFYTPDYSDPVEASKSDYRMTLYWNPQFAMEDFDPTPFQFYTGDITGNFSIVVEGITDDGIPFVGRRTISVK